MNICYIGNFQELSVGEPEIAKSLEQLGHKVFRLQERTTDVEEIKETIEREDCHLLLFAKFRIKNTPNERKQLLATIKIPSVCWTFDLYWGL